MTLSEHCRIFPSKGTETGSQSAQRDNDGSRAETEISESESPSETSSEE